MMMMMMMMIVLLFLVYAFVFVVVFLLVLKKLDQSNNSDNTDRGGLSPVQNVGKGFITQTKISRRIFAPLSPEEGERWIGHLFQKDNTNIAKIAMCSDTEPEGKFKKEGTLNLGQNCGKGTNGAQSQLGHH